MESGLMLMFGGRGEVYHSEKIFMIQNGRGEK